MQSVRGTLFLLFCLLVMASPLHAEMVNVNAADAEALAAYLKGIGPVRAKAIVDFRNQNGPFRSIEELANVPGIGDKILNQVRSELSLDQGAVKVDKKAAKEAKKAEKDAKKEEKKAEKDAKKEEKKADKDAKKAEKDAKKEAKKAEKEAKKDAKKAEKNTP